MELPTESVSKGYVQSDAFQQFASLISKNIETIEKSLPELNQLAKQIAAETNAIVKPGSRNIFVSINQNQSFTHATNDFQSQVTENHTNEEVILAAYGNQDLVSGTLEGTRRGHEAASQACAFIDYDNKEKQSECLKILTPIQFRQLYEAINIMAGMQSLSIHLKKGNKSESSSMSIKDAIEGLRRIVDPDDLYQQLLYRFIKALQAGQLGEAVKALINFINAVTRIGFGNEGVEELMSKITSILKKTMQNFNLEMSLDDLQVLSALRYYFEGKGQQDEEYRLALIITAFIDYLATRKLNVNELSNDQKAQISAHQKILQEQAENFSLQIYLQVLKNKLNNNLEKIYKQMSETFKEKMSVYLQDKQKNRENSYLFLASFIEDLKQPFDLYGFVRCLYVIQCYLTAIKFQKEKKEKSKLPSLKGNGQKFIRRLIAWLLECFGIEVEEKTDMIPKEHIKHYIDVICNKIGEMIGEMLPDPKGKLLNDLNEITAFLYQMVVKEYEVSHEKRKSRQ